MEFSYSVRGDTYQLWRSKNELWKYTDMTKYGSASLKYGSPMALHAGQETILDDRFHFLIL